VRFGGRGGRMLAARVEQKNGTYLNNIQYPKRSPIFAEPYTRRRIRYLS
jgi:hypothetical protein